MRTLVVLLAVGLVVYLETVARATTRRRLRGWRRRARAADPPVREASAASRVAKGFRRR
jgi:hypothetical protein